MRTKTLLLSAVALAAGLVSSVAQSNVYSANVVGYYNVTLTNGFTFYANQMDLDGSGTNNTVNTVIGTNLPLQSKVLGWNTNTQVFQTITLLASGWSAGAAGATVKQALQPGGGVFVSLPAGSPTNVTLTTVGNVLQRSNATPVVTGFQIVSYPFPISGGLTTNLNYIPNASAGTSHDKALTWNVGPQTYTTHTWLTSSWGAGDPQLGVGVCVFLQPWQPNTWTNQFFVQ